MSCKGLLCCGRSSCAANSDCKLLRSLLTMLLGLSSGPVSDESKSRLAALPPAAWIPTCCTDLQHMQCDVMNGAGVLTRLCNGVRTLISRTEQSQMGDLPCPGPNDAVREAGLIAWLALSGSCSAEQACLLSSRARLCNLEGVAGPLTPPCWLDSTAAACLAAKACPAAAESRMAALSADVA